MQPFTPRTVHLTMVSVAFFFCISGVYRFNNRLSNPFGLLHFQVPTTGKPAEVKLTKPLLEEFAKFFLAEKKNRTSKTTDKNIFWGCAKLSVPLRLLFG